ncbi:tRNA synthetases class I (M) domain-containing protein [Hirsutella rhossiliensis]|uniref:tRNA synthetases class I (M) domain-containing protein n=1 Tax=Hirsutella rhossiliensis TaxID=111463 RepID=A0A9P8SHA1_9HYPO|nr:tRNA synthetases class I (M) domain-containing protein [Hirsutella rhossiliensis]KAH0960801.1 tRNA synthetases class I (M) domain-containing protein [Hirsutella rhossiliensis]
MSSVFHSVIFLSSQIGTREAWTKLHHLSTTDCLTYEGGKFSKSRGLGVFGDSAQKTGVAADIWRYILLAHRPEAGESEFAWDSFISCDNNVLLKNLGNFPGHEINRSAHLFVRIKPEKAEEWRKVFGSDEVQKIKDEEAAMKAKKECS